MKKEWTSGPSGRVAGHRPASAQAGSAKASKRRLASASSCGRDGQVDGGRGRIDVAHERRELVEPRWPGRHRRDTSAADTRPRRSDAGSADVVVQTPSGTGKSSVDHEAVEHLAGGAGVHGWRPSKLNNGSSSSVAPSARRSTLRGEELADARPVRDEAALAELAAAHDEQLPARVDVAEAQAARLTGAQPEAVAEREDRVVGRPAADGPRVVGQAPRRRRAADGPGRGRRGTAGAVPSPVAGSRAAARPVRRCWVTAQSRKQPTIPTRWLKLRARGRGRDATNSSSRPA